MAFCWSDEEHEEKGSLKRDGGGHKSKALVMSGWRTTTVMAMTKKKWAKRGIVGSVVLGLLSNGFENVNET